MRDWLISHASYTLMNIMIDWSSYRVFLAVAECGSLSEAARRLNSSQPTIGRQIQSLEQALGRKLFARMPRGMVPTPAGEAILDAVRGMAEAALAVERRLSAGASDLPGEVRIAATEGIGSQWLTARLADFRRRHPEIVLTVTVSNHAADLSRREADIALRLFRMTAGDYVVKKLGPVAQGLYAASSYLARRGVPTSLADLHSHEMVGFTETGDRLPQAPHVERLAQGRYAFRSNSLLTQLQALRQGYGLGMTSCFLADPDPGLVRVLTTEVGYHFDAWAVVHRDLRQSPRIRLVFDEIVGLFAEDHALFAGRRSEDGEP